MKKIRIGIDTATTGAICVIQDNKILDVIKYPSLEYNKADERALDDLLKGETRKTHIKSLKAKKKALKRRGTRNFRQLYDLLNKYKKDIKSVIIEEPIRQSGIGTSIDALFANAMSLGVYTTICSILELPYKLYSPKEWHEFYDYNKEIPKGLTAKERRDIIKELSIKYCREKFENADDFIVIPRHKNPDDNIAESALIALIGELDNES